MKDRIPNILRAGVILMVLTVWLPTAAVLAYPTTMTGWSTRWQQRILGDRAVAVWLTHTGSKPSGRALCARIGNAQMISGG